MQESDNNSNSLAIYNVTHKLPKNEQKHENNLKLHIWKTEVYNVYVQVDTRYRVVLLKRPLTIKTVQL